MDDNTKSFRFEDCGLCGQVMEFGNLDMRNTLEDHEIVRFDFCPSCGTKVDTESFTPEGLTVWRLLATRWTIQRRLERKRLINGLKIG